MPAYLHPTTLAEAFEGLSQGEETRYLAGGTDLIVLLREGVIAPAALMDVKALPELQGITTTEDALEIGAAVSCGQLIASEHVGYGCTLLKQAASTLANPLLRNRATLIGNLCNASPGADMAPASLVLRGVLTTATPGGGRTIELKDFFTGVKRHVLEPNELVTKISFPLTKGRGIYLKKRRIHGHDLAQVGVAGFHDTDGSFRLALGAVATTPLLLDDFGTLSTTELANRREEIVSEAVGAARPISDVRASREYRLAMVRLFTERIVDAFANETEVQR
ncbi:MAG: xanthine dehydrogenase family protein subunit M [Coriobacteriales bacterium]|jgi:carbon-monoxide dehydrogenase medium subunit|nr:xanthine dehydrogenase family protein subunit M [Coriobacteriales bacterium]